MMRCRKDGSGSVALALAKAVAGTFSGRARAARQALVEGAPGLVWARGGQPRVVFAFTIVRGRITGMELIADAGRIAGMDVTVLEG